MPSFSNFMTAFALVCISICAICEVYLGNLGTCCMLCVPLFAASSFAVTAEPDIRQSRAMVSAILSGLCLMICIANMAPRDPRLDPPGHKYIITQASGASVLKASEAILLGYLAIHSLTEFALLQAMSDERDRRELFTNLSGFFNRYDSLRSNSSNPYNEIIPYNFHPFQGTAYKAGMIPESTGVHRSRPVDINQT